MPDRLAIEGGTPVRKQMLPYSHQVIEDRDVAAVVEVLRGKWLTTGPAVQCFERAVADRVHSEYAVSVTSGTAALHAAAYSAGIRHGDEAITSAISFAASANCIAYCGGIPRFADVQGDTLNLDPASVASLVNEKTRAIIAVDFGGQPADLAELAAIADKYGLVLIEDAAHALGATYRGKPVGSIADMTTFSTHPVKLITTGEGGVIVTNDSEYAGIIRSFRSHGISIDARERARRGDWFYEMYHLGYNYRLPDILCALGTEQLQRLDHWLARRREIVAIYSKAFEEIPEIQPLATRPDRESTWHLYVVRLDLDRIRVDRKQVYRALLSEGVGVNVHYIPIYWHPYYEAQGYHRGLCPVAEAQYERVLTLPLWAGMTDEDANDVVTAVAKVVAAYRK
ncbi:MAG: aminotransferase [Candidatus Hydrogenedentota bacterium]